MTGIAVGSQSPVTPSIVIASVVVLIVLAFGFVIGTPVLGLPIALGIVGVIALTEFQRQRRKNQSMKEFREEARTESIEFAARDRQTQT